MNNLKTLACCHFIPWILSAAILAAAAVTVSCATVDYDCYTDTECETIYGGTY